MSAVDMFADARALLEGNDPAETTPAPSPCVGCAERDAAITKQLDRIEAAAGDLLAFAERTEATLAPLATLANNPNALGGAVKALLGRGLGG